MSDIKYGGTGGSYEWSARAFPSTPLHASSLATTPLEVLDAHGERFTHGTGFILRLDDQPYLVTAWHIASGRNFLSRKLNPHGLIPRSFRMWVPSFKQDGDIISIGSNDFTLELFEESQKILESPPAPFGFPVDLAVWKLPLLTNRGGRFTSRGMENFKWGFGARKESPIRSMIGSDVFVLGYPLATFEGLRTPIWKRGSIASEPSFEISPKGAFLIDVNSTGGMSGGPIVRRVATFTANNTDDGVIEEFYDEMLIGMYSGRALSGSESSFVLGYGWPIDMVYEIIAKGMCASGHK